MGTEGGWTWAEPEMSYEEVETVAAPEAAPTLWTPDQPAPALTPDLVRRAMRGEEARRGGRPSPSAVQLATAGGVRLQMVMSRQLGYVVQGGLSRAWLAIARKSLESLPARIRPRF